MPKLSQSSQSLSQQDTQPTITNKTCTKCHRCLPEHMFSWRRMANNQRQSMCKRCFSNHEKDAKQNRTKCKVCHAEFTDEAPCRLGYCYPCFVKYNRRKCDVCNIKFHAWDENHPYRNKCQTCYYKEKGVSESAMCDIRHVREKIELPVLLPPTYKKQLIAGKFHPAFKCPEQLHAEHAKELEALQILNEKRVLVLKQEQEQEMTECIRNSNTVLQ